MSAYFTGHLFTLGALPQMTRLLDLGLALAGGGN
jgi:hypothetical protein